MEDRRSCRRRDGHSAPADLPIADLGLGPAASPDDDFAARRAADDRPRAARGDPGADILARADPEDAMATASRAARTASGPRAGRPTLGRFGWKAGAANRAASRPRRPSPGCRHRQLACPAGGRLHRGPGLCVDAPTGARGSTPNEEINRKLLDLVGVLRAQPAVPAGARGAPRCAARQATF